MPHPRRLAAALLAVGVVGVPSAARAATSPPDRAATSPPARVDFRFEDSRIDESSGLALSVRHPHTVWTVNDSGDAARVFAVDTRTGRTVGVHTFAAPVRDVEALAITPQGRMLVADIGDNTASRRVVSIYWFDEPGLGTTAGHGRTPSWELSYPGGPRDAEAIAVHPRSGRVFVVTKEAFGQVYELPESPSRRGVNRLVPVAPVGPMVTDAVFLPDASALAVRTYTTLEQLDPETFAGRQSTPLPLQPQGETIAVSPGSGLLVGSEGRHSRVRQVDVPDLPLVDPTLTATSPPTTSPPGPTPGTRSSAETRPRATGGVDSGFWTPTVVAVLAAVALLLLGAGYLVVRAVRPTRR